MDITTIGGLLLGFVSLLGAIVIEGKGNFGELGPFFTNYSAFVVIIGGTFGATVLSSKKRDVKNLWKITKNMFKEPQYDHVGVIDQITSLAEKARREGMLALESEIPEIQNPLMLKGLQLVIDGNDPELVEAILYTNLEQKKNEAAGDATMFETLGGFSPTMGIVGAIMGLVGALSRMAEVGMEGTIKALAVAFIASFWGVGLANLVFLPMCNKVRSRWRDEMIMNRIIIEGISSIQAGNNPRIVRDRLMSFLSIEDAQRAAETGEQAEGGRK